jgi:hypothetical protein
LWLYSSYRYSRASLVYRWLFDRIGIVVGIYGPKTRFLFFLEEVCKRRLSKGVFLHRWLQLGDLEKGSFMGTLRDS